MWHRLCEQGRGVNLQLQIRLLPHTHTYYRHDGGNVDVRSGWHLRDQAIHSPPGVYCPPCALQHIMNHVPAALSCFRRAQHLQVMAARLRALQVCPA